MSQLNPSTCLISPVSLISAKSSFHTGQNPGGSCPTSVPLTPTFLNITYNTRNHSPSLVCSTSIISCGPVLFIPTASTLILDISHLRGQFILQLIDWTFFLSFLKYQAAQVTFWPKTLEWPPCELRIKVHFFSMPYGTLLMSSGSSLPSRVDAHSHSHPYTCAHVRAPTYIHTYLNMHTYAHHTHTHSKPHTHTHS